MRRWLTQVLIAERVVAATPTGEGPVPTEADVLPDVVARMELGSIAAATVSDPHGRAVFSAITADVAVISVGHHDDRLLTLVGGPTAVDVAAGDTARLSVEVGTDAHADLTVEAHAISPWGTWEWLNPNIVGGVIPARGTVELIFDVAPPHGTEPGRWWALIRVACAGELVYSEAVPVTVR